MNDQAFLYSFNYSFPAVSQSSSIRGSGQPIESRNDLQQKKLAIGCLREYYLNIKIRKER